MYQKKFPPQLYLLTLLLLLPFSSCFSSQTDFDYIDICVGYRSDDISSQLDSFDPPGTLIFSDDLSIKDFRIIEIGAQGRYDLCYSFFLIGSAFVGWGGHGNFVETIDTPLVTANQTTAGLRSGRTQDLDIGLGYLISYNNYIGIAPMLGWAYDMQRIRTKNTYTDFVPDPILDDLKYTTTWSGPWAGIDVTVDLCYFALDFGYEFHWMDWKGEWLLNGPDVPDVAFSDIRRTNNTYGNLYYADVRVDFWYGWSLGLEVKVRDYIAKNGKVRLKNNHDALLIDLSPTEVEKVRKASWHSTAITLDVGYSF